jgi:hypothetical protein
MVYLRVEEGQGLHQSALRTLLCEIHGRVVCRARGTILSLLSFLYRLDVNKSNCAGTMEADPASWYAADPGNFRYAASASYPILFLLTLPRQTECKHQGVPTAVPTNFTRIGPPAACQPLFQHQNGLDSYQLEDSRRGWC